MFGEPVRRLSGLSVYHVVVARGVELEAIVGTVDRDYLALASPPELTPPSALRYLRPLIFGELVEDAIRKLSLWGVVTPIVEGTNLGAVLLELPAKNVVIRGLTGEAVAVLCQHHRDAASGHEVAYAVHAGTL